MRGFGLLLLVALASCSLLVSTGDDLSGGVVTPPLPDAGASDGPPTSIDGATTPDADSAAPSAGCDATFCDDFDEGSLGAKWTTMGVDNGELTLVPDGRSAPNALRLLLSATAATRKAQLVKSFPMPKHIRCAVEMFLAAGSPAPGQDVQLLAFTETGSDPYNVYLKIQASEAFVTEDPPGAPNRVLPLVPITPSKWVHLALDLDVTTSKLEVVIDDLVFPWTLTALPVGGAALSVVLGEPSDSDDGTFEARFDDFSCALTP